MFIDDVNNDNPEITKTALACHYSFSGTTLICAAIGEKDEIKTLNVLSKLESSGVSIQKIVGIIKGLNEEVKFKRILKKTSEENNFETLFISKHFAISQYLKSVYSDNYVKEIDFDEENKTDDEPSKDLFFSLIAEKSIIASDDIDINNVVSGSTLKAFKILVNGLSKDLIPGTKMPDYKFFKNILTNLAIETEIRLNIPGW